MGVDEQDAADGVYLLNAVARLLRASPYSGEDRDWAVSHAKQVENIAAAVARDAKLDVEMLDDGAKYVGNEWDHALIPILFGRERTLEIAKRVDDDLAGR